LKEGKEKMSDVILAGIIGGIIGVAGSVAGLIIQGHFSKKTTEMQINARMEEQKKQLESQKRQIEVAKSIEVKATYVYPIREQLWKLNNHASNARNNLRIIARPEVDVLGNYFEKQVTHEEALNALKESMVGIIDASSQTQQLMSRASDEKLIDLLSALQLYVFLISSNAEWLFLSDSSKKNEIGAISEYMSGLRSKVTDANKRTEELLSGIE
jgi:uncharacterized membrane-anchored protein YhcB (DUF1043 family)